MKISLTPLPLVEGKCPPVKRLALRDGRLREEWYYPDPKEDWKDPEIYETDNYRQEDKDEFYDYVTVCKACQTKFIAYKAGEKMMNYCPCCGKQMNLDSHKTHNKWADLCPICEYPFEHCQCRFGGNAHPDRSDRARVVADHLYLLTAGQLDHVMRVQSFWQTSYADEKRNNILLDLIHQAKKSRKEMSRNDLRAPYP